MEKASGIVLYKKSTGQIYNFTVNHKGNYIPLIRYGIDDKAQPYKYGDDFQAMYKSVLNIARENNFTFGKYHGFSMDFYDIAWIDIENPAEICKYGMKYKTENVSA